MSDLRKLSEAEWADTPGTPEYIRAATECYSQFRSGSLIPRAEYGRVLALLAEARDRLRHAPITGQFGNGMSEYGRMSEALWNWQDGNRATLSRIDDALAAEPEARG